MDTETGARSPVSASSSSLSTNATAFCIASIIGDHEHEGHMTAEQDRQDFSDHGLDGNEDDIESKISGELNMTHNLRLSLIGV